jgi:hypothetical protein
MTENFNYPYQEHELDRHPDRVRIRATVAAAVAEASDAKLQAEITKLELSRNAWVIKFIDKQKALTELKDKVRKLLEHLDAPVK